MNYLYHRKKDIKGDVLCSYADNTVWGVFETKHYVFHYFKNSVAEKEIEKISKTQEEAS